VIVNLVILGMILVQRLGELWLSNRNTKRLLAAGAHEVGAAHYPFMIVIHGLWLGALWWYAPWQPINWFWLSIFILLQAARIWMFFSLGQRWTTRIIILPAAPLVCKGPYRYVDHPNYLIVVGEIASLPLAFGLWKVALFFSVLNAAILVIRIRQENHALGR
jgi:methyltransferase